MFSTNVRIIERVEKEAFTKFCKVYLCPLRGDEELGIPLFFSRSNCHFPLPCEGARGLLPPPPPPWLVHGRSFLLSLRSMVKPSFFVFSLMKASLVNIDGAETTSRGDFIGIIGEDMHAQIHCSQNSMPLVTSRLPSLRQAKSDYCDQVGLRPYCPQLTVLY